MGDFVLKMTGKRQLFVGVLVGVLFSGVAVAVASIPDSGTKVISGCYIKRSGALRVIDYQRGIRCLTTEVLLQWNQGGPQGLQGLQGPQGLQGLQGPAGEAIVGYVHARTSGQDTVPLYSGPITATIASLTLPAGKHVVTAKVVIQSNYPGTAVNVFCSLRPGLDDHIDFSQTTVTFASTYAQTLVLTGASDSVGEVDVDLQCSAAPMNSPAPSDTRLATALMAKITAIKVAELNLSSEP
jgi:hypothetical protein